jgi:hypothetical protein
MRTFAIAALIAAIAAPAFAQPPMPTPEERAAQFKAADKNGDGKLDMAEFKAQMVARMAARGGDAPALTDDMVKQRFDGRDANKDGFIDATENSAPGGGRRG